MSLPSIHIESQIREKLPEIHLGCFKADVSVTKGSDSLLHEISKSINDIQNSINIEQVSDIHLIKSSKNAYRALGKDPSRYRPSAEALTRRILQGKGLYRVNDLVDSLNIFSIVTGISIGGYDIDKINGSINLSIGRQDDIYEAIGRGNLNIENLPVLRDKSGAFGSPTSDSIRTMITEETKTFLLVFFNFQGKSQLVKLLDKAETHFNKFNRLKNIEISIIS